MLLAPLPLNSKHSLVQGEKEWKNEKKKDSVATERCHFSIAPFPFFGRESVEKVFKEKKTEKETFVFSRSPAPSSTPSALYRRDWMGLKERDETS